MCSDSSDKTGMVRQSKPKTMLGSSAMLRAETQGSRFPSLNLVGEPATLSFRPESCCLRIASLVESYSGRKWALADRVASTPCPVNSFENALVANNILAGLF